MKMEVTVTEVRPGRLNYSLHAEGEASELEAAAMAAIGRGVRESINKFKMERVLQPDMAPVSIITFPAHRG